MKNLRTNAFSLLQKLGQSLMVPVSVLPAAGLLVALGRLLQEQKDIIVQYIWIKSETFQKFFHLLGLISARMDFPLSVLPR